MTTTRKILMVMSALAVVLGGCSVGQAVSQPTPLVDEQPSPAGPTALPPTPVLNPPNVATATQPVIATATQPPPATLDPGALTPQNPRPSIVPARPQANPQAVILVPEGDVLNARSGPGMNNDVVATLAPQARGVLLTNLNTMVGDDHWVEVVAPGGETGWVNDWYLTEDVPAAEFCADPAAAGLLTNLSLALQQKDGDLLSSLVSLVHGLNVHYFHHGNVANYSAQEARFLFESDYVMNWGAHPASGMEVRGTFHDEVLPMLLDVLSADYESYCSEVVTGGVSYMTSWPYEYGNVNFYSLVKPGSPGVDLDWRTWLVGMEYVGGKPYLFALIQYFWEP